MLALSGLLLVAFLTTVDAQAFSVARTTTMTGLGPTQVTYDKVLANVDGVFDEATSTFTSPVSGTYYFSFSAGLEPGKGSRLSMTRQAQEGVEVRNEDRNTDGQSVSSRGLFHYVQQGIAFTIVAALDEDHTVQGDPFTYQTNWNGFRYEDLADTFLAFSVAMSENQTTSANPLIYDTEVLNVGIDGPVFNMSSGIFTCQWPGVYFFHLSAGARPQREIRVNVTRNFPDEQIGSLIRTSRSHVGVDTLSRTLLVSLQTGDEVHVVNDLGSELYSTTGYHTSFTGFLYSLASQPDGIAFMAYRTESWESPVSESPILFDEVTVLKTSGFNVSTSIYTTGLPGSFFFSLSAGAAAFKPVSLVLRHNGAVAMQLESRSTVHNGIDTLSRDIVLDLANGDMLWVEADGGTALFSDIGMQTSWLGFRLRDPGTPDS